MNIRIEKKQGFLVAGIDRKNITSAECAPLWDELNSRFQKADLIKIGNGLSLGVCHDVTVPGQLNYMAGYLCEYRATAEEMGLDIIEVESAEYAIVELTGAIPECIRDGWKYFIEEYSPRHGCRHSGKPDFECYFKGNMKSPEFRMELWIPIVKA